MSPLLLQRLGRLSHLQYAKDGDWERAVTLTIDARPPGQSMLKSWLGSSLDFALEMTFKDDSGLPHFLGIRWLNRSATDLAEIIRKAHAILHTDQADTSAAGVVLALESALRARLLKSTPEFLELGVNNLWKSVGSLRIWQGQQASPQPDQLLHAINQHAPQFLLDQPNAVMLELGYTRPQAHWLGLCVSQRRGIRYRLDIDAVVDVAHLVSAACDVNHNAPDIGSPNQ